MSFTQNDWDAQLQMVAFAINNAKNVSTSYTPFYLNKGLHPRVPGICSFPAADDMEPRAVSFSAKMQDTIQNARKCLAAAQARWKATFDSKRGDVTFKKGDKVLLSTKNLKIKNDQRVVSRHCCLSLLALMMLLNVWARCLIDLHCHSPQGFIMFFMSLY